MRFLKHGFDKLQGTFSVVHSWHVGHFFEIMKYIGSYSQNPSALTKKDRGEKKKNPFTSHKSSVFLYF